MNQPNGLAKPGRKTNVRVTHIQFMRAHKFCTDNVSMFQERTYNQIATAAASVLGFPISQVTIGEIAADLGVVNTSRSKSIRATSSSERDQAIFRVLEELCESFDHKSESRDRMRAVFGVMPLTIAR